jgi:hypothetical protein
MTSVATTVGDAFRFYWRHGRLLLLASCLLVAPVKAIGLFFAAVSGTMAWAALPEMATATQVILGVVEHLAFMFGCGAVILLAADLETGGRGRWREAWSRALRRTGSIVRAYLAAYVVLVLVVLALGVGSARDGSLAAEIGATRLLWGAFLFVSPLFALIDPVSTIEGTGGFAAVGRSIGLLKNAFWRTVAPLWLLSAPVILLPPLFDALLPGCPVTADVLGTLSALLVGPLISVATLRLYREARARLEDYSDTQLRADLNAIVQ